MSHIKILVTGGAGYVGSVLIPKLLNKHEVRVLDNLAYGNHGIISLLGDSNFEFINGDVSNIDDIKSSLENIDFVIHLAAIVGYPACRAKSDRAYDVNYRGTRNLVDICKVPIIFASTGSNYGHVDTICTEETTLNPLTEYGLTKVKAEKEIQRSSDFVIYRFSTGFGLSLRLRLDLLINDFLFRAMKNKELIVFEKDYWRSFIHVKDMTRSIIFAIDNFDKMSGEIYNAGSDELCITKEKVALKIKEYVEYHLKFAEFDIDPDRRNYKVSFKKIRSLGFKTKFDLDYGIQEMMSAFEFLEQNKNHYNNKVFK